MLTMKEIHKSCNHLCITRKLQKGRIDLSVRRMSTLGSESVSEAEDRSRKY